MDDHTQFLASGRRLETIRLFLITLVVVVGTGGVLFAGLSFWFALVVGVALCTVIFFALEEDRIRGATTFQTQAQRDSAEAEAAVQLWRAALDQFPNPVVLLDQDGRILESNGRSHLLVSAAKPGRHVSAVFRSPEVLEAITRILRGAPEETVDFFSPVPVEREMRAHCIPVRLDARGEPKRVASPAGGGLIALIVLDDLTAARRVEQMRVDFIANASHELRTPLSSLSGFIETLRGHAKDDPEARDKFLEIMYQQSTRMRRLIDDLLSLSRIELNEHVPPSEEIDLAGVASDVIDTLKPIADAAGIEVRFVCPDDLPPALATREEMMQVFQNLIDNAIKYGVNGKHVDVRLSYRPPAGDEEANGFVALEVQDYGEGIPREDIPRLTERFYRVSVARSREQGGTGLGLAIVKHIVNRHRGQMEIDSRQGAGSTFRVLIPAV